MLWLVCGIAAFLLFLLYDIAEITNRFRVFRAGFFVGCFLLVLSTGGLVVQAWPAAALQPFRLLLWCIPALLCLLLLVYTLFFALPFGSTYADAGKEPGHPALCRSGVYALCRHPGVLWLSGFYLFLWGALGSGRLLAAFILYTLLDIGYVVFQDRITFMRLFDEYADYRKTTPFLLPTPDSIRDCFATLNKKH